jgi:glucosamine-6-phosphate deaminase
MTRELKFDSLPVNIYENRAYLGVNAALTVETKINQLLTQQKYVNVIFAAAPSQNEFLAALRNSSVNWACVNAFHMDEYVGLNDSAPQRFGNFLKDALFDRVPFNNVYYLNGNATNLAEECKAYSDLLLQYPTDIVCMGIGENGHIAFNDPPVADFSDPELVKVVELDDACRIQQVNDGCFAQLGSVPVNALTLTIPALMTARYVYCMVPGERKAEAVYNTLNQKMVELFPSTILRKHPNAVLYLDTASASLID